MYSVHLVVPLRKLMLLNMTTRMTLLLFAFALVAKADNLQGFLYGEKSAPDGTEWQNPELLALNKEQPRTCLFSFANTRRAIRLLHGRLLIPF